MDDAPPLPPLSYRGVVTQWHCDHIGHLNIAHFVSRFDEAHWTWFADLGLTAAWLRANRRGMAAIDQRLRYLREVCAGDTVAIRSRVVEVRAKVLVSEHVMIHEDSGAVCAHERIACALMDLDRRRATEFPAAVRASMVARIATHRLFDLPDRAGPGR